MASTLLRAALLTPPGRGAVASIAVVGTGADRLVDEMFQAASHKPPSTVAARRILLGRWVGDRKSDAGEELVVCRLAADRVEVHCHGGLAAANAILQSLRRQGCPTVEWAELDGETQIQSAARRALAQARTQRAAAVLLDQLRGSLRQAIEQATAALAIGQVADAERQIDRLLERSPVGLHLTQPWKIVLCGPPNVGKSSLINALLGFERNIVYDQPGTTRDVVTEATALDGWPVELSDTAGLRAAKEPIESAGIERARARIAAADLVVLVLDARRRDHSDVIAMRHDTPHHLTIYNKVDLVDDDWAGGDWAGGDWAGEGDDWAGKRELLVSATEPRGIEAWSRRMVDRLVPSPPEPGQAVPFHLEQVRALEQVRQALRDARFDAAHEQLDAMAR